MLAKMIFERLQSLKKNSPKEIQNIKDYDKIMQTIRDFINALLPWQRPLPPKYYVDILTGKSR